MVTKKGRQKFVVRKLLEMWVSVLKKSSNFYRRPPSMFLNTPLREEISAQIELQKHPINRPG
jgi:hypothetical protein